MNSFLLEMTVIAEFEAAIADRNSLQSTHSGHKVTGVCQPNVRIDFLTPSSVG